MYGNNKKKQLGGPYVNLMPNQNIGFGMQNAGSILPQSNISSTPFSMGDVGGSNPLTSILSKYAIPGIGVALQGFGAYRQAKNQQRALDSAIGVARNIPSMISDMYSPAMQRAQGAIGRAQGLVDQYNPYTGIMSRNLQRTIGSGLTQNIGATDPSMRKLLTRSALSQAQRTASDAIPMFAQQQGQAQNMLTGAERFLSGLDLDKGQALINAQENLAELEAARKGIDPFGQALGSIGGSLIGGMFGQAGGKTTNLSAKEDEFVNRRTKKDIRKGSKYHIHPKKGPMAGAVHNPNIKGGTKGHDFFDEKGDGGYIRGPHHGAGGVDVGNNVEVQGGEFVVNATSYNKHKSLIDAINMDDNEVVMMNALFGDKHSGADIHMNLQGGSTVNKAGNYTKPGMRKRIFNRIKAGGKGGNPGQWSARKAQMLAKAYKDAGGGYKAQGGMKAPQQSLKNWGEQNWDYISKGDEKKPKSERGRYLPESVRASLTPSQKASENEKKRTASREGKQNAKYSKDVATKVRNAQGGGMMSEGNLLNKIIKQAYGM